MLVNCTCRVHKLKSAIRKQIELLKFLITILPSLSAFWIIQSYKTLISIIIRTNLVSKLGYNRQQGIENSIKKLTTYSGERYQMEWIVNNEGNSRIQNIYRNCRGVYRTLLYLFNTSFLGPRGFLEKIPENLKCYAGFIYFIEKSAKTI